MSNIFSNLRWGILPLVLVTTTAGGVDNHGKK